MGNGQPAVPGYPPISLPGFNSDCGQGFQRFIKRRWPRSHIVPEASNESTTSEITRDENAEKDYNVWLQKSYSTFLERPESFCLPYCQLFVKGNPYAVFNFPPDSCRLKYPENTTGIYGQTAIPFRDNIDPVSFLKPDFDWINGWNAIETKFPFNETKNKENFLHQPTNQYPDDLNIEEIRPIWIAWFKEVWPCATYTGYLNQSNEEIALSRQEVLLLYDEWVEENFKKFWSRSPESNYWDWPLPYDVDIYSAEIKNRPPLVCQLRFGYQRTRALIGTAPSKSDHPLGEHYQPLWTSMYYNLSLGSMRKFQLASENIDFHSGDTEYTWVKEEPFDVFENYTWGAGGKMQRIYPTSWTPPYKSKNALFNYGAIYDWPDPYDVVTDIPLVDSTQMPFPTEEILSYWNHLINVFSVKNPRLYVPYYSVLGTPLQKKNYPTDRIGFKMFPEGQPYFSHNTNEMAAVDTFFVNHLSSFDKYLYSFYTSILEKLGAPRDPSFPVTSEYSSWRRSLLQAVHLRYAERHYFNPWERFATEDTTRLEWGNKSTIDDLAREAQLKFEWSKWVWADNFLTVDQMKALTAQSSPYNFRPFESEILPWSTLIYILNALQGRRKKGEGDNFIIDERFLDQSALYQFGQFVWHTRRKIGEDIRIINPTEPLVTFLHEYCGLSNLSSAQTWSRALSYLFHSLYDGIINSPSQTALRKVGQCIIDPTTPLSEKCTIYIVPEDEDPGGDEELSEKTICWELWRQQWYETEGRISWPTYQVDSEGNIGLVNGSQPIPGFWEKFWNTWFRSQNPPVWGVEPGTGNEIIQGFILPKSSREKPYSSELKKIYSFIRKFGMPIIRQKPPLVTPASWTRMKQDQWASYKEWVEFNVKAEKAEYYASPHSYMKDKEGNEVTIALGKKVDKLINSFPSFGVFPINSQTDFGWVWDPGSWTDQLFASPDLFALAEYFATKVAETVVKVLQDLVRIITENIDFWKFLMIGGAVVGGFIVLNKSIDRAFAPSVDARELAISSQRLKRKRLEESLLNR